MEGRTLNGFGIGIHSGNIYGLSFSSEWGGGPKYTVGGVNFFGKKLGGRHTSFGDQNVGSPKMTTDIVFILFKKTDFNTILAVQGVKCIGGGRG